jgi:WD40 repeat protein
MDNTVDIVHVIKEHKGAVYAIDKDDFFIYSGSGDRFVTRWEIQNGQQDKFAIKFEHAVFNLLLFDDSSKIAVGLENGHLHFFDLNERKELKFYVQHQTGIFGLLENKTKKHLYCTDADGNLSVWCTSTLQLLIYLPFVCGKIRRMTLDTSEDTLFLGGQDGFIYVLDTNYFNLLKRFFAHKDGVSSILWKDEKLISGGKDAWIRIWNTPEFRIEHSLPAHNFAIYDLVSWGESSILSASRDKTIKHWSWPSMHILQRIDAKKGGHQHSVNKICVLSEKHFASVSDDKSIRIFKQKG